MNCDLSVLLQKNTEAVLWEQRRRCNEISGRCGLLLTEDEMLELDKARRDALQMSGRIEVGAGVLEELVRAFCDSPYLLPDRYAETLAELQAAFYFLKSETRERLTDDELLHAMRRLFDEWAHGSCERVESASLELLRRAARSDRPFVIRGGEEETENDM